MRFAPGSGPENIFAAMRLRGIEKIKGQISLNPKPKVIISDW